MVKKMKKILPIMIFLSAVSAFAKNDNMQIQTVSAQTSDGASVQIPISEIKALSHNLQFGADCTPACDGTKGYYCVSGECKQQD